MIRGLRLIPVLLVVGCAVPPAGESESLLPGRNVLPADEIKEALSDTVDFSRHVKPLFEAKCVICHDSSAQPRGIWLDSRKAAMESMALGTFIVPGDSKRSLLVTKIRRASAHVKAMPPVGEQVTREEIAILERWIDQGAAWPASQ